MGAALVQAPEPSIETPTKFTSLQQNWVYPGVAFYCNILLNVDSILLFARCDLKKNHY